MDAKIFFCFYWIKQANYFVAEQKNNFENNK